MPSERSKGTHPNTGNSTKHEKTWLAVRVVKHWNRLPGEAVESLSLEMFRTQPDDSEFLSSALLYSR